MKKLSVVTVVLALGCGDPETGADGKTWLTAVSAATSGCANGGVTVAVGPDDNGNDVLDAAEVKSTALVCNGDDGSNGADGSDGADGNDGPAGADGDRWIVATADVGLESCAWAGFLVRVGRDLDGSGVLEAPEVVSTQTLCNPAVPATGVVVVWNGAGANDLWSNPANWEGNAAPKPGDTLSFPPTAAQKRNQNDFPNYTAFDAVQLNGNYELYGREIIVLRLIDTTEDITIDLPIALVRQTVIFARDALAFVNTIEGTGDVIIQGAGQVALSTTRVKSMDAGGTVLLNGTLTIGFSGVIFGTLAGTGNIIKTGFGQLTMGPLGTYLGTVFVQQGRLNMQTAMPSTNIVLSAGARLEGSTTVNSLFGEAGAVITPQGSPGNMIFINGLVLGGATYDMNITSSSSVGSDFLNSLTTANLTGSTLTVTLDYAPTIGDSHTPLTASAGLVGTFTNLPNNGTLLVGSVLLRATYTSNALVLTVEDT